MGLRGRYVGRVMKKTMLAQSAQRREWRIALALAAVLLLSGCGGGNLGELLKDSPSQQDKP